MPNHETAPAGARLSKRTIFFYGLTDMPVMMALIPLAVFLPNFYTSDLGLDLVMVANVLLITRLLDLLVDPLIGRLSDMSQSRWGRRRPWILASAPILALSFYMLFLPPPDATIWYLAGWMMLMWIGWSMLLIPYYAWAAELTTDFHERSVVTGWRSMAGVIGQLLAQVLPVIALAWFGYGGTGETLKLVGILVVVMIPVCILLTVTQVDEKRNYIRSVMPLMTGLKLMWTNGPFLRLVFAFLLSFTALAITTTLYLYYIRHVVGEEKRGIYMLLFFYVFNMAAVPFWVWLSRRIGKHKAWIASFVMISVVNPFYMLHGPGDFWWMAPLTILSGFAAGAFASLPNSMKADVIDVDSLRSGEDRAALYFAVWSVAQKASTSFAAWVALMGLAWFGFDPKVFTNGPDQIQGLKIMFALVPSVFFLAAGAVAWRYSITEESHAQVRAELERRRQAAAGVAE
ncbi:MFS transporter [Iodidimonas sp. SYSU 1G8]|uniref:MFS transporter n=1 Tax=Iodidimonas sp. SYSU 1G8 TaxID=3133967 RepID=UPI0031FF331E